MEKCSSVLLINSPTFTPYCVSQECNTGLFLPTIMAQIVVYIPPPKKGRDHSRLWPIRVVFDSGTWEVES